MVAEVLRPGQRTLIVGPAEERRCTFGLPPGGPFDPGAAAIANRAVGNPEHAAVLECAAVGPELRFRSRSLLAFCEADGRVRQFVVSAGERLTLGRIRGGLRAVLAMRGGFANPAAEFDLEPAAVSVGQNLHSALCETTAPRMSSSARDTARTIGAVAGPHPVAPEMLELLSSRLWRVTPQIDRVAVRLSSPFAGLAASPAMLRSCGMQFGTVQWHPGGELVAMGPDHPVTGGYLQVMTVLSTERWKLAHLAPGDDVRWMLTTD